jgi:branched-chain amino acid transport system substrate-binding protein
MPVLAGESIRIGMAVAMTGPGARENSINFRIAQLAATKINERGGVLGRPIELAEFDTRSTALGARQAALDAVREGVVAVVGPSWSSQAVVMGKIFQEAGIPMIGTTASAPEVTRVGDYIFRVCYTDDLQAKVLAGFACKDLRARRVAVVTVADDIYSEGLSSGFIESFSELGGAVPLQLRYLQNSMDFSGLVEVIREADPDVVFVPGYTRDSGLLLKQARGAGLTMPFLGGDGWTVLEHYPYLDPANGDNYFASHWHPDSGIEAGRLFMEDAREGLGTDTLRLLDAGIANTYDALGLVADAIRRAGSAEPAAIRNALARTENYPGVTGSISFKNSRDPVKPLVILRITARAVQFVKMVEPAP